MPFAGIAWSEHGFTVEILSDDGRPAGPTRSFRGADLADLVAHVTHGPRPLVVIDSTNGVLDGTLLAAGLDVRRADPPLLCGQPPSAATLARLGLRDSDALAPLTLTEGSLAGRLDDLTAAWAAVESRVADLTAAGRCAEYGDRTAARIALTFDDGPHPTYTGLVLDVLDRYEVLATFFCVGLNVAGQQETLARMSESGHEIGNHTWSHPYLPDLSSTELRAQVSRTTDALALPTALLRPPYGSLSPSVLDAWADLDETVVLWDVEAEDWALPGAPTIAQHVLDRTHPGSIVLLHDGGGDRSQTVAALPAIIEGCLDRGLHFTTVTSLLAG